MFQQHHSGMTEEQRRAAREAWASGAGGRWIAATSGLGTGVDINGGRGNREGGHVGSIRGRGRAEGRGGMAVAGRGGGLCRVQYAAAVRRRTRGRWGDPGSQKGSGEQCTPVKWEEVRRLLVADGLSSYYKCPLPLDWCAERGPGMRVQRGGLGCSSAGGVGAGDGAGKVWDGRAR